MTQLTLLVKAYSPNMLKRIDETLRTKLEGLEAKTEFSLSEKWVRVSVSGEDAAIATNYINKEFGACPVTLENVKRFDNLRGYIKEIRGISDTLRVDVGVFEPEIIYSTVPLRVLQAVLVDGRKVALRKIIELFGLFDGLPFRVKIEALNKAEKRIEAELAAEQLVTFSTWRESMLDRLIVLGASQQELSMALKYSGLTRDIISIESLGMFEHAMTCKLGTDAAGLVSQVGRILRDAKFAVFNPRKIRELLNY